MESLLVDIKFIPKGFCDFKYLLVTTCEIMNFVLVIPSESKAVQAVAEVLIHRFIYISGQSKLVDTDSAFTGEVI